MKKFSKTNHLSKPKSNPSIWLNDKSKAYSISMMASIIPATIISLLSQISSFPFSEKISKMNGEINTITQEHVAFFNHKIDTNNKISKAIFSLEHATRHIIQEISKEPKYNQHQCSFLLKSYKIDTLEDNMHNEGSNLQLYDGKNVFNQGKAFTNWFNINKTTCFYHVKNTQNLLEKKTRNLTKAIEKESTQNLNL